MSIRTSSGKCLFEKFLPVYIVASGLSCVSGASDWPALKNEIRSEFPSVPQMTIADLRGLSAEESTIVIDVRAADEYAMSTLPGALHAQTASDAEEIIASTPGRRVVLYCSVGYRSSAVAAQLLERGYSNIYNLEGSIFEWVNSGGEVVRNGEAVREVHPYDRKWSKLLDRQYWPERW